MTLDGLESGWNPEGASAWEIAKHYHELKKNPKFREKLSKFRSISARAIIDQAREVLGSLVHPVHSASCSLDAVPELARQVEMNLDETLENSLPTLAGAPLRPEDIWVDYQVSRSQSIVITVDTSLSMTGEKLALTAVALAVVLLEFPDDPIGLIAFENEARVIKALNEKLTVEKMVERFLDVPAQGYTHLEDGMKAAVKMVREAHPSNKPLSTVLLTDGKYTAGRDPSYLASRLDHLLILKMGRERASRDLCREMAKKGRGQLQEVGELETLPGVMYGIVKDLLRGCSKNAMGLF